MPQAGYGQSFVLVSLQELERLIGDVGLASLAFAAAATVASGLVLAAASLRPRLGTMAALAVTTAVGVGMTAAADIHYVSNRSAVRSISSADPSWVDAARAAP